MDDYSDIFQDIIFPSFIRSCKVNVNNDKLSEECYKIEKEIPGKNVSNIGGYQSPTFSTKEINSMIEYESINHLIYVVRKFAQETANVHNLNLEVSSCSFWTNINKSHHYNVLHNHGGTDIVGVYYAKLPENSGDLFLMRNDGASYSNLYRNMSDQIRFACNVECGRLYLFPGHLWHFVTSNMSDEDRISLSFNISFDY